MSLEILQNSQQITCVEVSFLIKLQALTLLKKRFPYRCFPVNFAKFSRTSYSMNTSNGCFVIILTSVIRFISNNKSIRTFALLFDKIKGVSHLTYCRDLMTSNDFQKQPSRGVLRKSCSENMPQIYRRTPMPKCDFNKVALFLRTPLGGLLLLDFPVALIIITAKTQGFNVRIFVVLCSKLLWHYFDIIWYIV